MNDNVATLPLVSVLIPAYNKPNYLKLALNSVINQTYRNIEIIICDDSTNDEVKRTVEPYLGIFRNIKYYYNNGPLGENGINNCKKCLNLCSGEYVNFLMDDDIFHPTKIERMIECFYKYKNISMVTSYRQKIDSIGNTIPDDISNMKRYSYDVCLQGEAVIKEIITEILNFIGEPTTVLFKKALIDSYGSFLGYQCSYIVDVAMWLSLLLKGNCVYISDTLSCFRRHAQQNSLNRILIVHGWMDWIYLLDKSYAINLITINEYKAVLKKWKREHSDIINSIRNDVQFSQHLTFLRKIEMI
jgi:Glycosyltransferases involved in cell wall biogenesis